MRDTRTLPLLRNLPREAKLFCGLIMLVLGVGYVHALAYVFLTTRMIPKGIEQRYRGSEQVADSDTSKMSSEEAEDAARTQRTEGTQSPTGELQYEKSL